MQVNALDHVNVITSDLERSCALGHGCRPRWPAAADPAERPVDVLRGPRDRPHQYRGTARAPSTARSNPALTGAVHHVALSCSGHDELIARIEALGLPYQANFVVSIGLRQVFVADPDNASRPTTFWGSLPTEFR